MNLVCSCRAIYISRINISSRRFHVSCVRHIDPRNVEEIRIPVPWGHIAGKWWGKKDVQPVVAVHGWQDNAGTWDPLALLIPEKFSVLAIDLPGNGFSSHLPPLQNYYTSDTVLVLRRVKQHFSFGKLNLMGHSCGSSTCFLYSCMFPEDVKSFFGIDFLLECSGDEKRVAVMGDLIDKKIDLGLRIHSQSKRYTWDEAMKIWIEGSQQSLNNKTCQILMERGVTRVENDKVIFNRDQRLKLPDLVELSAQEVYKIGTEIRCDVRLVKGLKSNFFDNGIRNCPDVLEILKCYASSFQLYSLDGNHHVHMEKAEECVLLLLELLEFRENLVDKIKY